MASDRDDLNDRERSTDRDKTSESHDKKDTHHVRTIGTGMNSLDSTQAPLRADTGEPDWDAMKGRVGSNDADREREGRSDRDGEMRDSGTNDRESKR